MSVWEYNDAATVGQSSFETCEISCATGKSEQCKFVHVDVHLDAIGWTSQSTCIDLQGMPKAKKKPNPEP